MNLPQKKPSKKNILAVVLVVALVGLIACQQTPQGPTKAIYGQSKAAVQMLNQGVKVRPAYDGSDFRFVAEIVDIALKKFGYKVEEKIKLITPAPLLHVALGYGDVDFTAVHWESLYEKFFERGGGSKRLERVGVIASNLLQGYQIDKKTAVKYKITNIAQLKDPKLAKLFDTDGNGKANLVNCPVGWGCDEVIEHQLKVYELQDTVEFDRKAVQIQLADTFTRYKQRQPVLYYCWTPSWLNEVLKNVVWLEVPFTSYPKGMGDYTEKDTSVNGKNLGFAVDRLRILANKEFLEDNPGAKRLFELIHIPVEDINTELKLVFKGENKPEDILRHANEWIQKHQQLFDSWIEEAKKAGKTSG